MSTQPEPRRDAVRRAAATRADVARLADLADLAAAALPALDEPVPPQGVHRQFLTTLVPRNSCGCTPTKIQPARADVVTRDPSQRKVHP